MAEDHYDEEEYKTMINDCFDREGQLTDWERGFMSTCLDMTDKSIMLTQRQREVLENVWERIT